MSRKRRVSPWDAWITRYMEAAEQHGADSDPDMEVGDLQALIYALAPLVPEDKRAELADQFHEFLQQWGV